MQSLEENNIACCGVSTHGSSLVGENVSINNLIFWSEEQWFAVETNWTNKQVWWDLRNTSLYVKETPENGKLLENCILFIVYNCNTRFGGIRHNEGSNNAFAKLKTLLLKKSLVSVGYQEHIFFNCICNAVETSDWCWEHYL